MDIKEYISRVKDLEVSCYEQSLYLNELKNERQRVQKPQLHSAVKPEQSSLCKKYEGTGCATAASVALAGLIISLALNFAIDLSLVSILVFIGVGICLGIVVSIVLNAKVRADQKRIDNVTKQENENIQRRNTAILNAVPKKVQLVDAELAKATKLYQETCDLLQKYYDEGVVFEKYRGMVPICMFHEYLQSGRCSSLTGHEGAYNIYETELRMNIILVKLDEIIENLKRIEDNQYVLAEAIRESTTEVKKLGYVVQNNLESINENTAISAYYSKWTTMFTAFNAYFSYDTNEKVSRALSDRS